MKVGLFHSLRFRLIAGVVLIEITMLSALVLNNLNTIYKTHTDRLSDTADSIIQQFSRTAGDYLFEVDYASLQEHANHTLKHSEVIYLSVMDINRQPIVTVGELPDGSLPELEAHPTEVVDEIYDTSREIKLSGRLMGYTQIGFSMGLMQDAIDKTRSQSIAIAATEILLTVIVTIWLGMRLTRDIHTLSDAAAQVGEGNYDMTVPVTRRDELGLTAIAFNKMVKEIAERTRLANEREQRIRLLLNTTEEGIYGADINGICTFVNSACLRMLGYDSESDFIGKNIHELIHHSHPDGTHYPKEDCTVRKATLAGSMGHSDSEVHWRSDGSSFPTEYWSHPIRQDGKTVGTVVTFIDITQRKTDQAELDKHRFHLEQLVDERTEEITRLYNELESFSYSVSHDLRAPLRAVDGFSLALVEDYGDQLDGAAKDYLNRLRDSAQRMGDLIDDLLLLSRMTRHDMNIDSIDLSQMAAEIITKFKQQSADRHVEINITPALTAMCDERLIHVALENLLSNAWKYTEKEEHAVIEFGSTEQDGQQVYFIRDNGVGFDMKYSDKLFGAFERLHGRDEFEGSGIGLATVQRVINRHHGSIWAESGIGQGSSFYFTLGQLSKS